jgi:hypothetical protein
MVWKKAYGMGESKSNKRNYVKELWEIPTVKNFTRAIEKID